MTSQASTLNSPRLQFDDSNPYAGDLFKRREIAVQLTGYIDRLRDGTVLAIDAPWGEGKSWFGLNWAADLKSQDYRVIYLDSFQQDYVEDPFLLIASEINDVIAVEDGVGDELKHKAATVMKALLPFSTKVLLNIAGRLALGTVDASKDLEDAIQKAGENAADESQKWLENKIEDHSKEKESVENFRNALSEFCASQDKPVVFFIDELDRCRPLFAVKLIERLKHFFDVPNLVFVLLLNRDQLEKAIKGVYGSETDASSYLGKFVHMYLRLPKRAIALGDHGNSNWNYLWKLADHYKFPRSQELEQFINCLSILASIMKLSLRDLEKCVALLALNGVSNSAIYLAWSIALKLKHPQIFYGLLLDDINSHIQASELLSKMVPSEYAHFWIKDYFYPLHMIAANCADKLSEDQINNMKRLQPNGFYNGSPLNFWLNRIDIAIQD